jgi:hypothetical protein
MIYKHDIENLQFNILRIGDYELCVFARLFDLGIGISTVRSRLQKSFIATFPVEKNDEAIHHLYCLLAEVLRQNPTIAPEALVLPGKSIAPEGVKVSQYLQSLLVSPCETLPNIPMATLDQIAAIIHGHIHQSKAGPPVNN